MRWVGGWVQGHFAHCGRYGLWDTGLTAPSQRVALCDGSVGGLVGWWAMGQRVAYAQDARLFPGVGDGGG